MGHGLSRESIGGKAPASEGGNSRRFAAFEHPEKPDHLRVAGVDRLCGSGRCAARRNANILRVSSGEGRAHERDSSDECKNVCDPSTEPLIIAAFLTANAKSANANRGPK